MMKALKPARLSAMARAMPPKPQPMIRIGVAVAGADRAAAVCPEATRRSIRPPSRIPLLRERREDISRVRTSPPDHRPREILPAHLRFRPIEGSSDDPCRGHHALLRFLSQAESRIRNPLSGREIP